MKAWYVCERDGDGGGIVWADTQGKAKYKAWKSLEILDTCDDWREIECRRAPAFDGEERELTGRDWVEADYTFPCEHCERTVHKDGIWISPDDDEWTMPVFGAHGEVYCSDECRDKEVAFFTVG